MAPGPILRGSKGEPLWPAGVVGSITHCAGYRAAAVARQTQLAGIGIDAEVHAPLPAGIEDRVCSAEETAWLKQQSGSVHWDRVLFSAKESVYKAWFPIAQRWLDFTDVAIAFKPAGGEFQVWPRVSLPGEFEEMLRQFEGRFLVRDGIVITVVVLASGVKARCPNSAVVRCI